MDPKQSYIDIEENYREKCASTKRLLRNSSIFRLSAFVLTVVVAWAIGEEGYWWIPCLLGLIVLLVLVRRHLVLKEKLNRFSRIKKYAEYELSLSKASASDFEGGYEFIDPNHPYTSDLGVFGKSSIFGFLDRTKSEDGASILASKLMENETETEKILNERAKIKAYANAPEFIFKFLAGVEIAFHKESDEEHRSKADVHPHSNWIYLLCNRLLTAVMLLATTAVILGYLSFSQFLWFLLISAIPVSLTLRRHMADFSRYDAVLNSAKGYKECLSLLLDKKANSPVVEEWFVESELHRSLNAIGELERIKEAIDARDNLFVGIVLNLLLLWDFQNHRRLCRWHEAYRDRFEVWKTLVHRMEANFSLSLYTFNHPEFCYPEFVDDNRFEMRDLRHVILGRNAVPNSLVISEEGKLMIVTGANMAGKSTFLRTVGTNLILAMRGLPVSASAFRFRPTRIFTSMLTADSLGEGESYFFSELSRLKTMTDMLESGTALFVILDEILKGTNSVDKAEGSKLFVEKLLKLPAKGLIATHDLSLCEMESEHPKSITNRSFEVEFHNGELQFDYTLRDGVCRNMNARFLLRKMGLTND